MNEVSMIEYKGEELNYYELQAINSELEFEGKAVHEWRSYLTDGLKKQWILFNHPQRIEIARCLQDIADSEVWN
jgi:hypothetical protein